MSHRSRNHSGGLSAAVIGKIKAAEDFPGGKFTAVFYLGNKTRMSDNVV